MKIIREQKLTAADLADAEIGAASPDPIGLQPALSPAGDDRPSAVGTGPVGSPTSARPSWPSRRCGHWSTPGSTSPWSCRSPTAVAAGAARRLRRPVKAAALELGLPVTDRVDDVLDAGVDLGVVVAYGRLIRPHVLAVVPMVNLHFSLLPRWRGAAPVERAILAGDDRTGVDLMVVEEGLDTGDDLRPDRAAASAPTTPSRSSAARLVAAGTDTARRASRAGPRHPAAAGGGADLCGQDRSRTSCAIDWSRPAVDVHRLVRLGGAWTTYHGRRLKVWRTTTSRRPRRPARSCRRATGLSSSSRCSPRARPASRRRLGQRCPLGAGGPVGHVSGTSQGTGRSSSGARRSGAPSAPSGPRPARVLALDALDRIDPGGAYANLLLPELLGRSRAGAARPPLRHRARLRHHPHASCLRLPRRPLPHPRPRPARAATPCASAPTSSTSCRRRRTRRSARRSRPHRRRPAGSSTPCCGGSRRAPSSGPTTPRGSAIRTGSSSSSPPTSARRTPSPRWRR